MGVVPSPLWAAMARAVEPQPQPISSMAIAALTASTPAPPYSSGMFKPSSPSGPILRTAGPVELVRHIHFMGFGLYFFRDEIMNGFFPDLLFFR